ncbi:DUF6941 family protein [Nocardia sp. NPDC059246]|uniref:DUF6941 family protein n=1 Tax=unclassified Nocardia TaxID=2637762 RepID=UPI0036A07008
MRLTVLIADTAQIDASGKVHVLGLGWNQTTTPTPPMALVVMIVADAEESIGGEISLTGMLLDENDEIAAFGDGDDRQGLAFHTSLTGVTKAGRGFAVLNIGPGVPLKPGRYTWQVQVDDTDIYERVPFEAIG